MDCGSGRHTDVLGGQFQQRLPDDLQRLRGGELQFEPGDLLPQPDHRLVDLDPPGRCNIKGPHACSTTHRFGCGGTNPRTRTLYRRSPRR